MEQANVLHVGELGRLERCCVDYVMVAENVGVAVEQGNVQNARARVE